MIHLKKLSLVLLSLMIAFCMVVSLAGCGETDEKNDTASGDDTATESALSNVEPTFPNDIDLTEYQTEYCTLYYPAEYKNIVTTDEKDGTVTFYAEIKDVKKPLFTIYFGKDTGHLLGTLKTDDGDVSVSIENPEFIEEKKWDNEDVAQFEKMQEDVNVLLDALWANESFTPSGS